MKKTIHVLLFVVLVLTLNTFDAMETASESQAEINKICEQIEKREKPSKVEFIRRVLSKSEEENLAGVEIKNSLFYELVIDPTRIPLLEAAVEKLPKTENNMLFKHNLLLEMVKNENLEGASVLVRSGARAEYDFIETVRNNSGEWEQRKSNSILENCSVSAHDKWEFLLLFLRNGLDPNYKVKQIYHPEQSLSYIFRNSSQAVYTLLYYGAKFKSCDLPYWSRVSSQSHARRVHRLAHYLMRCFGSLEHPKMKAHHLPVEIALMIAEYHYGQLSEEDKIYMRSFQCDDYKKVITK